MRVLARPWLLLLLACLCLPGDPAWLEIRTDADMAYAASAWCRSLLHGTPQILRDPDTHSVLGLRCERAPR